MKVTTRKKTRFLQHLREGMPVVHACTQINVSNVHMYRLRRGDPDFKAQWDEAIEEWEATLLQRMEAEADRRAMEGNKRPVGFHQGKPWGAVTEYSDTLLIFRMKALAPEKYRDNASLRIDGKLQHEHGPPAARMSPEDAAAIEAASPEMRREMLRVIKGSK